MAVDVKCMTHSDKQASGYCSRCQMPYCADCLDVEMGQPLCKICKSKFSPAAPSAPPAAPAGAGSPLNFKGKGMDDDPLGLFGAGPGSAPLPKLEPKTPTPKLELPKAMQTFSSLPPVAKPPIPSPVPVTSPKPSLDLDSFTQAPQPVRTPFPTAPSLGAPTLTPGAPSPFSVDSGIAPPPKKNKMISLTKIWTKYLIRRSYEMFDPLAKKMHVPTYVFLVLLASLISAAVIGLGALLNRPSVAMAETIPAIHIIKVNASQVSEMDVTTYTDLQNQLQGMGFTPLIQMTIPQIPSPNFFDVGIKDNIGIYSEILKMPGQITPHLSFVTVFTNGVWFSTNGWQGDNQTMEYLVSQYFPTATPDQLYVKHVQALEKLKQEKDWQVSGMNENRYMAALSDHLRWFLVKKDIQGYKADFAMWH
jgi:hypothetical protein